VDAAGGDRDLVVVGDDLHDRGEVAAASHERVGDDAHEHPDRDADEEDADECLDRHGGRSENEDRREEEPEEKAVDRAGARGSGVAESACDALDRAETLPDDRDVPCRNVGRDERRHSLLRGLVAGEFGDRLTDLAAPLTHSPAHHAHLLILPRGRGYAGTVSQQRVFVARLSGCAVFDPAGDRLGKVRDVVVIYRKDDPPRVIGLIVEIPGRRHVFVSIGRVTSIATGQVITTGLINVRRFQQRGGEVRVMAELLGRKVFLTDGSGTAIIEDVAIERNRLGEWDIGQLFLRRPKTSASPFAKGPTTFAEWSGVRETQVPGEAQSAEQLVATFSELKPADLANTLLDLPDDRLIEVAEELPDDRLADALEEMPEEDQVHILEALGDERAADILDAMEPDDAADVLSQLSEDRLEELLDLMEPEEAEDVRALLKYGSDTAGGLMTPEPIVLSADATVAEALALIRRHELHPALAAAVFVTLPPYETPTGRLLGTVHFQRMLRYPPHERLGAIIDDSLDPVLVTASAAEVARLLASYNLVSVPIVDQAHRLVGAVSVDDVLDYLLPEDWRSHDGDDDIEPVPTTTASILRRR
jgi:flagellar motility protein MotE (MotC chaperone)/sporulation protein YlmC with PRC-barrel domain